MAVVCLTPFFCLTFLLRSRARVCVLQPVTLALLQGLVALFNYIGAYSRWAVKKKNKRGRGGFLLRYAETLGREEEEGAQLPRAFVCECVCECDCECVTQGRDLHGFLCLSFSGFEFALKRTQPLVTGQWLRCLVLAFLCFSCTSPDQPCKA